MKYLTLIRHGDATTDNEKRIDINRSLSPRGKKEAIETGKKFKQEKKVFEKIFSSTAKRAIHTAELIAIELSYPIEIITTDMRIYEDDAIQLIFFIHGLKDQFDSIAIFGHNPVLTDLGTLLTGEKISPLPTCGVIELEFNLSAWEKINYESGTLIKTFSPSEE